MTPGSRTYVTRTRALRAAARGTGQAARSDLERDLTQFEQMILQDLQYRHHSDGAEMFGHRKGRGAACALVPRRQAGAYGLGLSLQEAWSALCVFL
jgi:hypothetical protein